MRENKQVGYTLIELILAIALFAVIVSVVTGAYLFSAHRAKCYAINIFEFEICEDFISHINLESFSVVKESINAEKKFFVIDSYDTAGLPIRVFKTDSLAGNYFFELHSDTANESSQIFLDITCKLCKMYKDEKIVCHVFKIGKNY